MKIRIYNARILTMEKGKDIICGELWVEEDRICYVGEPRKDVSGDWDREIDAGGNLVMPGFKNAHAHSAMTFLRSYADDLPLASWLNDKIFPMEAKLNPEYIYDLTKLAILEYLTSGITAAADMYLTPESIARASVECGFRMVLVGGMNNFSQSPELLDTWYREMNHYNPLIQFQLGFHAEYTTSRTLLEAVAELAKRYHAPVFCHNSETRSEVEGCVERYGVTPTVLFDRLGIYDYGGGGYHCIYMSEEDLGIFRDRKLSAVHNPASNLKLASGIAPIRKMHDMGISLALGTDGPASNNCLDMFREMFLAAGLAKIYDMDASAMDGMDVLHMATTGGAASMGLTDCDVLAEGKQADLIILDLQQPNMQPFNDIPRNVVYSGSKSNVAMTMIAGRVLYENGRFFVGQDPREIYERANEIITKLGEK